MPRKSLEDLERNPKNIRYHELLAVLRELGFEVREGTRHGAIAVRGTLRLTVPRPHGKHVKPVYVRLALKALREEQ